MSVEGKVLLHELHPRSAHLLSSFSARGEFPHYLAQFFGCVSNRKRACLHEMREAEVDHPALKRRKRYEKCRQSVQPPPVKHR